MHLIWIQLIKRGETVEVNFENAAPISTLLTLFAWRVLMYATNDASNYFDKKSNTAPTILPNRYVSIKYEAMRGIRTDL